MTLSYKKKYQWQMSLKVLEKRKSLKVLEKRKLNLKKETFLVSWHGSCIYYHMPSYQKENYIKKKKRERHLLEHD